MPPRQGRRWATHIQMGMVNYKVFGRVDSFTASASFTGSAEFFATSTASASATLVNNLLAQGPRKVTRAKTCFDPRADVQSFMTKRRAGAGNSHR